ncbi:dipeptidase [bacterium AH-315-P15]|nr:dipeptidase [bacterium AH-315-P15]
MTGGYDSVGAAARGQKLICLTVLLGAALILSACSPEREDTDLETRARALHQQIISIDTHVDIPHEYASYELDPGGYTIHQVDLPKMRAGGLDAPFFVIYTPQGELSEDWYARAAQFALGDYHAIRRLADGYPRQIALALTAAEVREIKSSGRRVALIGLENGYPFGESTDPIEAWYDRGVRYIGLLHDGHNQFGDSAQPLVSRGDEETRHGGLSDLGRAAVREMNRLGIMVDVSHSARTTMLDMVETSAAPVIASHSNARAMTDHPRNLDDEQLRALAQSGGVVQVTAFSSYLRPRSEEMTAARRHIAEELGLRGREPLTPLPEALYFAYRQRTAELDAIEPRANVSDLIDNIDYITGLIGVEHVGISSDFGGGGGIIGWEDASTTVAITAELMRRGYSDREIEMIWGGNLLRVMDEVERTARSFD